MADADILFRLESLLQSRKGASAESSYVASLYAKGLDHILKKVGEEAVEMILAAKSTDHDHTTKEAADLLFHTLVMLGEKEIPLSDVLAELARREGTSGHAEKQSRSTS